MPAATVLSEDTHQLAPPLPAPYPPMLQLLDISFAGPSTLRIEHGDTTDKIKVRGAGDQSAALDEELPPTQSMGGASVAMSVATSTTVSPSSASIRVTYDSFTLTFRDAGVAQRAAAAIMFQQAQYAAVRHWLRAGLHAGFRCDLISVKALPLLYDDSQHPTHTTGPGGLCSSKSGLARGHSILPPHVLYSCASGSFGRTSYSGGSGAGAASGAAGTVSTAAAAYAWGDADAQDWGCSVPLPAGWGPVLDAVESSGSARAGEDGPGVTPEELTCPVVLEHGPKAIQVKPSAVDTDMLAFARHLLQQTASLCYCVPCGARCGKTSFRCCHVGCNPDQQQSGRPRFALLGLDMCRLRSARHWVQQ